MDGGWNSGTGSFLDRPILGPNRLSLEVCLYVLLVLVATVACFYNLGERTLSHDEAVHSMYSHELYAGQGFVHDPWRHGPFLYHINAFLFTLFGVSDYTTRMSTAAFGVILVLLPCLLRKELGQMGALSVSAMTLISPSTLYYARYIRNEIYMMVWAMLMLIAMVRYLDDAKPKWLYVGALALTLALCSKETAYITGFIGATFLAVLAAKHFFPARWIRVVSVELLCVVVLAAFLLLSTSLGIGGGAGGLQEPAGLGPLAEVALLAFGMTLIVLLSWIHVRPSQDLKPTLSLLGSYVLAIGTFFGVCVAGGALAWLAVVQLEAGIVPPPVFVGLQVMTVAGGMVGGGFLWWRLYQRARSRGWVPAALDLRVMVSVLVSAVVVFVLLYTTFLTNPRGVITGTVGGLSYWFAQQEVKRASQPWYYYLIIAPLYEFLPIGLGLVAMAYYALRRNGQGSATQQVLVAYLVYWTLSAWLIYSWAGEKMPWMMVHIIQPMIVLSGRFLDDVFGIVRRRVFCSSGAIWLVVVCSLLLVASAMVVLMPLVGSAFQESEDTLSWFGVLLASVILAVAAYKLWVRVGRSMGWRAVLAAGVGLGMVLTVRYAWMANYINHDTAREFLVYSHGAPGAKQTVHEIREISRRLYGDPEAIRLAYGADGTCPFEWYFSRYFPNRVFFGEEPSRAATDVPVLVGGQPEIPKVEPYLGNRYLRFDRKYLWFPHQAYYMNLSLAIPKEEEREPGKNYFLLDMLDPAKRRAFWRVLFYRQYEETAADWEPSSPGKFAFYLRKDIALQLWDIGALSLMSDDDA